MLAGDVLKKAGVVRVGEALRDAGLSAEIVRLEDTARSAQEAAAALGVEVAQIVKSLVFRGSESGDVLLVLASGVNRADEKVVSEIFSETVERPDAKFVKGSTGYSIGGVPPIGYARPPATIVDEDLLAYDEVWAAAGHTHAVFPISPKDLVRVTGGRVVAIYDASAREFVYPASPFRLLISRA